MMWTRGETFKDRCDRLLRDVIVGEYRYPTPMDHLTEEMVAADAVLVWLDSIGLGSDTSQQDHVRHYLQDIAELLSKVQEAQSATPAPVRHSDADG